MIFTVDIGNTNIVIGIFEQNKLTHKWRLPSDVKKSADDYAIDLIELCLTAKIDCLQISGSVIASVVPEITQKISEAIEKFTNCKALIIADENVKLGIDVQVTNQKEVGEDRLVNAIAAYKKFGGNLIIVDFGTATTFDVVGENGEYLGGVISPGINLSLKALHDMTAKLPRIEIESQKNVIGKTTIEAMNSGVYFGYISLIEGMINKIENEFGSKTTRVMTGGLSEIFKDALSNCIAYNEPDLTLEGLNIIHEMNK